MQNNKSVGKLTTGDILVFNWKAYYTFGEGREERTYQSYSLCCWRWWWGCWWRQTRSPEVGSESSRPSDVVCLPCRCIVNRCRDLTGSQTHHKHHIKDELINAHPDVNYHKRKTLKHFFFKNSTTPISVVLFSEVIYHSQLFSTCDRFIIHARALLWPFQACKINTYGGEPHQNPGVCMHADTWARTKRGRWKWEVLLTSTPDSCSWISKNSCGRWQVLVSFLLIIPKHWNTLQLNDFILCKVRDWYFHKKRSRKVNWTETIAKYFLYYTRSFIQVQVYGK